MYVDINRHKNAGDFFVALVTSDEGGFYLGRVLGTGEALLYDAADLTTHGVIVGMTGSGKTGLGIGLVEEALLHGISCLVIDPKGDMGNLLLTFPDFSPADFEPWIDAAAAAREGRSPAQVAADTAEAWRKGLASHGIGPDRVRRLREEADVTLYTPGSSAGIGLDVLGSLDPPAGLDWETDAEVARDQIRSLVSSLLVLVGVDSDPVAGPEHILLSTIVETLWRERRALDLATLVSNVTDPPFRRLGVFDVDTFLPEQARTSLALKLNGLLASPSFASWLDGVPVDIEAILGGDRPRAAIVYLAHLGDDERQFIVTMLLSKMVTWIRSQPGTSELRTLIYMDEVFGYAPPTAEPPSKRPILTIAKQARAHGVGMVLATQNPVDLDYKAMANAGTWLVGRLQTENDKRRILEGLRAASGNVDVARLDTLITGLGRREFVLHSTKANAPVVFSTRWAMSYLAGPLTREQVSTLMEGRRPVVAAVAPEPAPGGGAGDGVAARPVVAAGISASYLDDRAPWIGEVGGVPGGNVVEAAAAVTVQLLYDDRAAGIDHRETFEAVLHPLGGSVDRVVQVDHDPRDFREEPPEGVLFRVPDVPIDAKAFWTDLRSRFVDHLVAHRPVEVLRNRELGLYSRLDEGEEAFRARCRGAAEAAADVAVAKLRDRYRTRIERVRDQLSLAAARAEEAAQDADARRQEEVVAGAGDLLGALLGGRSRSNPLGQAASRRTRTQNARARTRSAADRVTGKQRELEELEDELAREIAEIVESHERLETAIETVRIGLERSDVEVADLRLVWIPVGRT